MLDVDQGREGQSAAADQPQRRVRPLRGDRAERGAALAPVAEGGEIGLQLHLRGERRDGAERETRLFIGRGAVGGSALVLDDGDEAVTAGEARSRYHAPLPKPAKASMLSRLPIAARAVSPPSS